MCQIPMFSIEGLMIISILLWICLAMWAAVIFAVAMLFRQAKQPKDWREKLDDLDAEIDRQQSRAAKADQRKRSEIYVKLLERVK